MKKINLLMIIVFIASSLFCQQVTREEAVSAAVNTLKNNGYTGITKGNLSDVYTIQNGDTTLIYEVVFKSGEMVMLSGNKCCLPVLGYRLSPKSHDTISMLNNYNKLPCGLRGLIDEYSEEIEYCFRNNVATDYQNNWHELLKPQTKGGTRTVVVAPLLTTKWGQNWSNDSVYCDAYNYYVTATNHLCDCNGQKCATGCVATAMAQIMGYWKHPVIKPNNTSHYDWCNMPDSLIASSTNYFNERNAIAKLMKDCGTAVNMLYCQTGIVESCASSADSQDVPGAFEILNYPGAEYKSKSSYPVTWVDKLKDDLDNHYPIYYSGKDNTYYVAHAFVCDGYDSNDKFHFNWGWNGRYSDNSFWFTLSQLNPDPYFSFVSKQKAVLNIHPDASNHEYYCDFDLYLDNYYQKYYITSGNTTPQPWQNVPKTATTLTSASKNMSSLWRTIPANQSAEYVAHEEILLQDGFEAETNSDFYAHIVPCEQCDSRESDRGEMLLDYGKGSNGYLERIDEAHQSTGLILHPNPTTGVVHITFSDNNKTIRQINVSNLLGAIVLENTNPQGNTLDVSALPAGVYIVRVVTNDGKQEFVKLVKR